MNTETATTVRIVTTGTAATVTHWGTKFGPECGAGFNRKGGVPQVVKFDGPVTCTRKACKNHA